MAESEVIPPNELKMSETDLQNLGANEVSNSDSVQSSEETTQSGAGISNPNTGTEDETAQKADSQDSERTQGVESSNPNNNSVAKEHPFTDSLGREVKEHPWTIHKKMKQKQGPIV